MEVPIGGPSMPGSETQEEPAISIAGEEEAPVEAPPQPPAETATEAPTAPPPKAGAKPGFIGKIMGSKILMILAVVGVVVILLAASMIYLMYGVSGVDRVHLNVNDVPYDPANNTVMGIEINVITSSLGTDSFSGDATVKIIYDDTSETSYTGKISMSNDKGRGIIEYEDFLIGPGAYYVKVSAGGQSAQTIYTCDQLLEEVSLQPDPDNPDPDFANYYHIYAGWKYEGWDEINGDWDSTADPNPDYGVIGALYFGVVSGILPGTTLDIALMNGSQTLDSESNIDLFEYHIGNNNSVIYPFMMDYGLPGDFTFEATVYNPVDPSSDYYEIEMDDYTHYFNAKPLVDAGPEQEANPPPPAGSDTVYFEVEYRDENKNAISTSTDKNDADIMWTFPNHDEEDEEDYHDYGPNAENDYSWEANDPKYRVLVQVQDPDDPEMVGNDETAVQVNS